MKTKKQTKRPPKDTYVSECGYHVKCENAKVGQVCVHSENLNHITLTKTDLEYLLGLMNGETIVLLNWKAKQ